MSDLTDYLKDCGEWSDMAVIIEALDSGYKPSIEESKKLAGRIYAAYLEWKGDQHD